MIGNDYIVINQFAPKGKYWINFMGKQSNEAGRIQAMLDGQGDINSVIANLLSNGYNKGQILYNGRPLTDAFHKNLEIVA